MSKLTITSGPPDQKIAWGTKNLAKEPAMTREQAVAAIEVGIRTAEDLKEKGYQILATGEMGIGNTTTSSAIASVLLEETGGTYDRAGSGTFQRGTFKKSGSD